MLRNLKANTSSSQHQMKFKVLILYEDLTTGICAQHIYGFLAQELGGEERFCAQMWKFDLMREGSKRLIAAHQAAEADLIMIATYGRHMVPAEVEAWMDLWISLRGNVSGGLVVLFDQRRRKGRQVEAVERYLEYMASRSGMDFFSHAVRGNLPSQGLLGKKTPHMTGQGDLEGLVPDRRDYTHWGINE